MGLDQKAARIGKLSAIYAMGSIGKHLIAMLLLPVFTYYLVEALHSPGADENSNGWISAEEAHRYLDGRVDSYVWNHTSPRVHQNPQIGDGVGGEVDITRPVSCSSCPSW